MKTKNTRIELARLKKLLAHMKNKRNLRHKEFRFRNFCTVLDTDNPAKPYCGTAGCMGGEVPGIWPRHWKWVEGVHGQSFYPCLRNPSDPTNTVTRYDLGEFFGLSESQTRHLFYPDWQNPEAYGGQTLSHTATRKEVVDQLDTFIRLAQQGLIKYEGVA